MMKISRVLSTQHPDNVTIPFFAENSVMNGDDKVKEAFHVLKETSKIMAAFKNKNAEEIKERVVKAGKIRKFLG